MAKAPTIDWQKIAKDDYVFRFGDYCLRVEKMDKKYWWWCVYYKEDYVGFDEPKAKTEFEAKMFAELSFNTHYDTNNK